MPGRLCRAQLARPMDHQPRLAAAARPDQQPHAGGAILAAPSVEHVQLALPQGLEKRNDLVTRVEQRGGTGRFRTLRRVGLQDLRGRAPRQGRQVAAEKAQQDLGRGPGGELAKALTAVRLGVVHHTLGDDERRHVLHVGRKADDRALHVQAENVPLGLAQLIPDPRLPDQVAAGAQRPHADPPRGLRRQLAAVVEQRLLNPLPAPRGQLRLAAFQTNQLAALQLPDHFGPIGAALPAIGRRQRVAPVEQFFQDPIGLHRSRPWPPGQPRCRRGECRCKTLGRLFPCRAEGESHRIGAERRRRAAGRRHDFAHVVAINPVGDDHVAQLRFLRIAGAHAAHGQAARLVGVHQPRRRVARGLPAHLVGPAQGHAQSPAAIGGLIPAPPDREPESRWPRRLFPFLQPALVHRAHRVILARRSGDDQHVDRLDRRPYDRFRLQKVHLTGTPERDYTSNQGEHVGGTCSNPWTRREEALRPIRCPVGGNHALARV